MDNDIVGLYHLPSGNHEGGTSIHILENHKFLITYFGGMHHSDWTIRENKIIFEGNVEPQFVLYARQNKKLKKAAQIILW